MVNEDAFRSPAHGAMRATRPCREASWSERRRGAAASGERRSRDGGAVVPLPSLELPEPSVPVLSWHSRQAAATATAATAATVAVAATAAALAGTGHDGKRQRMSVQLDEDEGGAGGDDSDAEYERPATAAPVQNLNINTHPLATPYMDDRDRAFYTQLRVQRGNDTASIMSRSFGQLEVRDPDTSGVAAHDSDDEPELPDAAAFETAASASGGSSGGNGNVRRKRSVPALVPTSSFTNTAFDDVPVAAALATNSTATATATTAAASTRASAASVFLPPPPIHRAELPPNFHASSAYSAAHPTTFTTTTTATIVATTTTTTTSAAAAGVTFTPTRDEMTSRAERRVRESQLLERVVGSMVANETVSVVVLDFDKTLIDIHTKSRWGSTARELERHVRPVFRALVPLLLRRNIIVGIATLSCQEALIRELMVNVWPADVRLDENVFVRCARSTDRIPLVRRDSSLGMEELMAAAASEPSSSAPTALHNDHHLHADEVGKRFHIADILSRAHLPNLPHHRVLFIDDDKNNADCAVADGFRVVQYCLERHHEDDDEFLNTCLRVVLRAAPVSSSSSSSSS